MQLLYLKFGTHLQFVQKQKWLDDYDIDAKHKMLKHFYRCQSNRFQTKVYVNIVNICFDFVILLSAFLSL